MIVYAHGDFEWLLALNIIVFLAQDPLWCFLWWVLQCIPTRHCGIDVFQRHLVVKSHRARQWKIITMSYYNLYWSMSCNYGFWSNLSTLRSCYFSMTTSYYVLSSATWEWVNGALPSQQRVNEALEFKWIFAICDFLGKLIYLTKMSTFLQIQTFI
jgi:hypothetical protein